MGEHLASAVIITYNQEKYIEQTIECALAQKADFSYEIVIGEDCSTDRTREICLSYQEKYPNIIRVITSDKNVGLLDNWYRSVKAARGKYIAGCGGDDYWHNPDKMQKQVRFLEENPDYGMVHSDADILFEEKGLLHKNNNEFCQKKLDSESKDLLANILTMNYTVWPSSMVFKKSLFDKYYDFPEIKKNKFMMEDMPLWIELAVHSKIHYIHESLYTYRRLRGTISQPKSVSKKIELTQSTYDCAVYYFEKYKDDILDKEKVSANIHSIYNHAIMDMAVAKCDVGLIKKSYYNIKALSGSSHIHVKDRICFFSASLPLGVRFYRLIHLIILTNVSRCFRRLNRMVSPKSKNFIRRINNR